MKKVLLMGFRKQIAEVLDKKNVPYYIWNNKKIKSKTRSAGTTIEKYPSTSKEFFSCMSEDMGITHVIAGTESASLPAAKARGWLKIPGNPAELVQLCSDKLLMKRYFSEKDVPMTDFIEGNKDADLEELFQYLGKPFLAKERSNSGGRGITLIRTKENLLERTGGDDIFEKIIHGKEGSVESFIFEGKIVFQNITEYERNKQCNIAPSSYTQAIKDQILDLNQKVLKDLRVDFGLTHLEFYLTEKGILFGEIALRPPGGYIMNIIQEAYKFNPWEAFVCVELGTFPQINQNFRNFCASYVIHPGQGKIKSIKGEDEVRALPSLKKLKLKIKEGESSATREGTGDDKGYAIFVSDSASSLLRDIKEFRKVLDFELY